MTTNIRLKGIGQSLVVCLNPTRDVCRLPQFLERDPYGEDDVYQHQHALLRGIDKEVAWLMVRPSVVQLQHLITDMEREMILEDLRGQGTIRVFHFLKEPGRLLMSDAHSAGRIEHC